MEFHKSPLALPLPDPFVFGQYPKLFESLEALLGFAWQRKRFGQWQERQDEDYRT